MMNAFAPQHQAEMKEIAAANKNVGKTSTVAIGAVLGYVATLAGLVVMKDPATAAHAALDATNSLAFAAFVATIPVHVYLSNKRKNLENQFIQSHGTPEEKEYGQNLAKEQSTNLFHRVLSVATIITGSIAAAKLAVLVTGNASMSLPVIVVSTVVGSAVFSKIAQKVQDNRHEREGLTYKIAVREGAVGQEQEDAKPVAPKP